VRDRQEAAPADEQQPLSCTEQTARYGSASLQPQKRADQQQSFLGSPKMPRVTCRSWTAEQIKLSAAEYRLPVLPWC
jgi:hypothetical protein